MGEKIMKHLCTFDTKIMFYTNSYKAVVKQ